MNWAEILKGKKQLVAIMTILMLAQTKAEPIYMTVVCITAIIVQGALDIFKYLVKEKNNEKNDVSHIGSNANGTTGL